MPSLSWRAGDVPVSQTYDDPYFALQGGWDEAHHVFLAGNDLPARFAPGFGMAELGFGTGLTLLAAGAAWRASGQAGVLWFTSFEAHPLRAADMARALGGFGALPGADALVAAWAKAEGPVRHLDLGAVRAEVHIGPAEVCLPAWEDAADAWCLDGFAPAKNPAMWSPELMAQVHAHTRQGGSFATFTAAGAVRRALTEAGFEVTRTPGFGRKRHMLRGRKP